MTMAESSSVIAVVTETWFREGPLLQERREEAEKMMGLHMHTRSRPLAENGVSYGGVALLWRGGRANFVKVPIKNNAYEVLAAAGSLPGYSRKIIVLACYLQVRADALHFISDTPAYLKKRFKDPYLVICGRWMIACGTTQVSRRLWLGRPGEGGI